MVCLLLTLFLACAATLQACPDPINILFQNYEGPIILHRANCDSQQQRCQGNKQSCYYDNQHCGHYGNQYKHGCCDTECNCVSKQSYVPYAYGSVATNVGCGCCPVAETQPLVYCVCNKYGSNGYSDYCVGSQGYPNYQSKYSGC